jgi:hypothetical protein
LSGSTKGISGSDSPSDTTGARRPTGGRLAAIVAVTFTVREPRWRRVAGEGWSPARSVAPTRCSDTVLERVAASDAAAAITLA